MSANGNGRTAAGSVIDIAGRVDAALTRLMQGTGADGVFGAPERVGDRLVITAASVERAGGFGFGGGTNDEEDEQQSGGGGGGGGSARSRPVAVIVVEPEGVTVQPVIDFTRVGITILTSIIGLVRALR